MKGGFTIRGLSTAASIWMAAAVGVVIGLGFYAAAILAALAITAVMGSFRKLEKALPHHKALHLSLVFERHEAPKMDIIKGRMKAHGYVVVDGIYALQDGGKRFSYELVLQAIAGDQIQLLLDNLMGDRTLVEFRLSPARN
jgi:putative Mg2+ transporter-C (MgtC) family protein